MTPHRTRLTAAAASVATLALFGSLLSNPAVAAEQRNYTAGQFSLEVANVNVGPLHQVSGGGIKGAVVEDKIGASVFPKKHIGSIKYEDLIVQSGTGLSKGFFDWMKQSVSGNGPRKSVALNEANFNGDIQSKTVFNNSLITDVTFPELDAASKLPAFFTVTITPESSQRQASSGKVQSSAAKEKNSLASNFRIRIPGLEDATQYVSKIESLGVRYKIPSHVGIDAREYQTSPAVADISNLVFYVPEGHTTSLDKYQNDFLIKGNHGESNEKTVTIDLLDASLSKAIFTITLTGVGLVGVTTAPITPSDSATLRRSKVEMYVSGISFDYNPSAL